jgi:hypothetical protein
MQRLARFTDVGRSLLYAEIAAGRLIASKAGRRTIVSKKNAQAWLDSLPVIGAHVDGLPITPPARDDLED